MTRWHKFWTLPTTQKKILLLAVCLLPLTRLALRLFGFEPVRNWFQRSPLPPHPLDDKSIQHATQTGRIVNTAAYVLRFRDTCLERSLVLWWLLRRQGVASDLRIGVSKVEDGLHAHAWVEINGVPINDRDNIGDQFAAFDAPFVGKKADDR